jgi:hypothetical protein
MKNTKPKQAGSQPAAEEPLTPADLRAISDEIAHEFPLTGEQSGVVLMDVDPHRLHAYWNLWSETLQRAQADFAVAGQKTHLVLRFRELPDQEADAHHSGMLPLEAFDRELWDAQGHVEVDVRGAGERYEAELGLTADDGGWKSLARSNRVRMPPAGPTPELGMETLNVAAALPPAEAAEEGGKPPAADFAEGLPMADDPSLRGGPADVLEPEFPNTTRPERSSEAEFTAAQQVEVDVPPAPDTYFEAAGFPDLAATVKGFSSAALSSSALGELEIHAELHVYGRARPGRELFLFGRRVPLAPDGTFDIRRVLDPESLLLPLLMTGVESPTEG